MISRVGDVAVVAAVIRRANATLGEPWGSGGGGLVQYRNTRACGGLHCGGWARRVGVGVARCRGQDAAGRGWMGGIRVGRESEGD